MYAKIENGVVTSYPYFTQTLKAENPNTSFPEGELSAEILAAYGVVKVQPTATPEVEYTKNVKQASPVKQGDIYVQSWEVVDASEEEVQFRTEGKATEVRFERDRLLALSDWTQVSDAPVDQAAWATYRQALRDITSQEGFPFSVTWPSKP